MKKIRVILTGFFLCFLSVPAFYADIGEKPMMAFEIRYDVRPELRILEASLMQCDESACVSAEPLAEYGPQGFHCDRNFCQAFAYGFKKYQKIVINFSDGKRRESTAFSTDNFQARFLIAVKEDILVVRELAPDKKKNSNTSLNPFFKL